MQVSIETLDGLERRMTVRVPAEKIDQEVESRLRNLVRKVKIDGFRPGKVPFKVVKRMYGPQVRQEVMGEELEQSFRQALDQEKLRPAHTPRIEPLTDAEGLNYAAVFEVFPEFEVVGLDQISVTRPVVEVTEEDVDRMLETLRKQRKEWRAVERPAQQDDRLTISFEGKIDGEEFPGGKAESTQVVLGEGRMLPTFEENLQGLKQSDEKTFDLTFPDDYQADLAGKTATFQVKVEEVAESELPTIDDEFAAGYGIDDPTVEGLRKALRETMERELQDSIKAGIKRQVMDGLLTANEDVSVPQAMVKEEIEGLARQAGVGRQEDEADSEELATLKQQMFGEEAGRRVALGLIVSRLVEAQNIRLDPARVQARLEAMAASYPAANAEAVIRMYRESPQAMESIRAMALEEQAVDWLLERARVEEQPSTFDEVMKPTHAAHDHHHHHGHDHDHDHDVPPPQPEAGE